jgi:cytochrome-b5 reductase
MTILCRTLCLSAHESLKISGGTGITPFVQLLNSVFSPAPEEPLRTRFTLLHSSPTPSSLPPAEILEPLREYASKRPDSFFLQLHVDSLDKDKDAAYRNKVKEGRIGKRQLEDTLRKRGIIRPLPSWWDIWDLWVSNEHPQPRKVLFLVCGPEP